jgi:hypothetical protein
MMKTVNIIGRGRGRGKGLVAEGEKFTCNYYTPGVDIVFEIHTDKNTPNAEKVKCAEAGIPVITQSEYPIDAIQAKFKTNFFVNTICYMIAYALYLGYEKIVLWGCNIIPKSDDEPIVKNHPGVEYWIGYAQGLGVEVEVQGESYILSLPKGRYGYDY